MRSSRCTLPRFWNLFRIGKWLQYSKLNSLDSQQTKKNWIKHCTALSFQSVHLLKLTLKEVNVCTYLMEIKVVLYSLFFSLTSAVLCTILLWSLTQYHATKPMQMLEIFSYQSILQYTCLLREASQQSREVIVAHVEDPMYQSHKWQLMKWRYSCNG